MRVFARTLFVLLLIALPLLALVSVFWVVPNKQIEQPGVEVPAPQKWCPREIHGRILIHSIYREPDADESALVCFYQMRKVKKS